MMAYQYQPVRPTRDGRHLIRLFDLFPGGADQPITGQIHIVRLATEPYEALSYHWGRDQDAKVPIRCDGGVLEITESLHIALRYLRRRRQRRRLWIDAICINQADLEERGYQVSIMRAIYSKAQQVVVWLGEHSDVDDSKTAMTLIPVLADVSSTTTTTGSDSDTLVEGSPTASDKELGALMLREHGVTDEGLRAVAKLLERPWFRRIWAVQELAVSAHCVVICGTSMVIWTSFVLAALHVLGHRDMQEAVLSPFLQPIFDLELARSAYMQEQPQDLLTLLFRYRKFEASDPRDKVYALLGLLSPRMVQHLDLYPDYELSAPELFREVAGKILSTSTYLDSICCLRTQKEAPLTPTDGEDAEDDSDEDELPSWAPDWSLTNEIVPLTGRRSNNEYLHSYNAAKNSTASLMFIDEGDILCLSGLLVDKVLTVGMVMNYANLRRGQAGPSAADTAQNETHFNWEKISQVKTKKRYVTGETLVDVYYQTLVADSYQATGATREEFDQWDDFSQQFRWIYDGGWDKTPVVSFFAMLFVWLMLFVKNFKKVMSPDYPLTRDLASKMIAATSHRRMIRTRNGYIGLAPEGTQKGDFIGVFKGGRAPLVIRSDGPNWKIVGESYIHGIMQGEAWNEQLCGMMRFQ